MPVLAASSGILSPCAWRRRNSSRIGSRPPLAQEALAFRRRSAARAEYPRHVEPLKSRNQRSRFETSAVPAGWEPPPLRSGVVLPSPASDPPLAPSSLGCSDGSGRPTNNGQRFRRRAGRDSGSFRHSNWLDTRRQDAREEGTSPVLAFATISGLQGYYRSGHGEERAGGR
jgi:hypothetical protein